MTVRRAGAFELELVDDYDSRNDRPAPEAPVAPFELRLVRESPPERYVAPDSHRAHGTYVKYVVERCKCEPCRQANRDYEQRRQRAMRRPDEAWVPYVDAEPARRHVRALMEFGIGPKHLAVVSGVPHGAISKLIYGDYKGRPQSKRIRPDTSRKLLAVQPTIDNLGSRVPIPSGPYLAMVDDLVARGWTRAWIASQIAGKPVKSLQIRNREIAAGNAVKIRDLHRSLAGQTGPGRKNPWDTRRRRDAEAAS